MSLFSAQMGIGWQNREWDERTGQCLSRGLPVPGRGIIMKLMKLKFQGPSLEQTPSKALGETK